MKMPIYAATCLLFGLLGPLMAQNFNDEVAVVASVKSVPNLPAAGPLGLGEMPPTEKAQATAVETPVTYSPQDSSTLEPRLANHPRLESIVDLSVLQQPSPFRAVATGHSADASDAETNGIKRDLALISATYRVAGKRDTNCLYIGLSIEQRIKLDPSIVLEVVETEVKSNASCTCEIVKAAIKATDADTELIISIIETVISSAPQSMMIATQCAIAASPESLAGVQALLSKYDANAGESVDSSKDAKGAKVATAIMPDTVASMPNPLDFPGQGPIGPTNGIQPVLGPPPPILTSPVTQVSP